MFKEALLCGIGMICDISGSHYFQHEATAPTAVEGVASDWKRVGLLLADSIKSERPKIEAEAAKQLQLKLG